MLIGGLYLVWELRGLRKQVEVALMRTPMDTQDTLTNLVSVDERIALRESQYDTRIAEIKERLAVQSNVREREVTHGKVLHPNVHNLPHDVVQNVQSNVQGEVSE